ncbi:ATP-binding cassette domain-containing protein [Falsihalocynthiibacter sp. SS001]|uniref:ATP-binding cassette domain-containing protein n=1 Tax=Falsihalocynthiibacter sp. SS001 TaxID=3349698 RepID=UPI0036D383DB
MNLISTRGLTITKGRKTILESVDFHIDKGEIVTLVGPNGSGKSTLVRALIGAVSGNGSIQRAKGLKIGYVPQKLQIDPTLPLSVERFLALPHRHPSDVINDALEKAGAGHIAKHAMADISGGQTQRVLLARALLNKPDLLILDEATQGLDQPGAAAFYHQIADVRDRLGCAVLMVSHDLHVVMAASDRVICLNGHVCCHGTPAIVASAPEYRALFGTGTEGALALYQHKHSHRHDEFCDHESEENAHAG